MEFPKAVEVTLHLNEKDLDALKSALQRQKVELLAALERIDVDLDNIQRAMSPIPLTQERWVLSEADPNKSYLVTYFSNIRLWDCTCPSRQFQTGTDENGFCKHIRRVKREGWFKV